MDEIFKTMAGSHLYGTANENSDLDVRGVVFEPLASLVGLSPFEQFEHGGEDTTLYGLRKFAKLALAGNPNIVELLFAPTHGATCLTMTKYWNRILGIRPKFIDPRSVATKFIAFSLSQYNKMLAHQDWVKNPPTEPNPKSYGAVFKFGGNVQWTDHNLKIEYDQDKTNWENYQRWLRERNRDRFNNELKFGYDTKNAAHLVRLMNQAVELLAIGAITFPRPEAELLKDIRNGAWTIEQVGTFFERGRALINSFVEQTVSYYDPAGVADVVEDINLEYIYEKEKKNRKWTSHKF